MGRTAALLLCVIVASGAAARGDEADTKDQWKSTDRSMSELLSDGYELAAVVPSSSSHGFVYFLKNHGKLARCREETSLDVSSISPPPMRGAAGSRNPSMSPPQDMPVPKVQVSIECAELVKGSQ